MIIEFIDLHANTTASNTQEKWKGWLIVKEFYTKLVSLKAHSHDQCHHINLSIFNACNILITQKKTCPLIGEVGTDGSVMSACNHQ